jgi:glycerophosphoryl diester phosphodiesterase
MILFLFSCALIAQERVDSIRTRILQSDGSVLIIAHRANGSSFPENSVSAILSSSKMGADIVEIDVRRTSDGGFVLMHDHTLGRTTDGKGFVSGKSLDYITGLHLKGKDGKITSEKVPSLEEALLAAKEAGVMVNIDKAFIFAPEIAEIAQRTGTLKHLIFKSDASPEEVLCTLGPWRDSVIYMPMVGLDSEESLRKVVEVVDKLHPVMIEVYSAYKGDVKPLMLRNFLGEGCRLWYNSDLGKPFNAKKDAFLIDSFGAGAIQTDHPKELNEFLKERKQ